jgi:hypothetical protein
MSDDVLNAEWFDTDIYSGCLALSLVLPDYVPLKGVYPIRVVEEFFIDRGAGAPKVDDSWMVRPYTVMTKWVPRPWPVQPTLEDYSIAEETLNRATGGEAEAQGRPLPERSAGQRRSVVIVVLPVKARQLALSPTDGAVGALTLVHWILGDWLRAVRMASRAPIGELTQSRLPPLIPVRYASVVEGAKLDWAHERHDLVNGQLMNRVLPQPIIPRSRAGSVGDAFAQITWGRPGAIMLDQVRRGDAAALNGDDIGAVLAYATACELAITNLALALAWEDGLQAREAARIFRDMSVTRIVTSLCHSLGGTWAVDAPGVAMDWRIHIADVRNRIIHTGFRPTSIEVQRANRALKALLPAIAKSVIRKWKRYPRTVSLLVSRGSIDLYASKKAHGQIVEGLEARSHAAEEEFAAWRRTYYRAPAS